MDSATKLKDDDLINPFHSNAIEISENDNVSIVNITKKRLKGKRYVNENVNVDVTMVMESRTQMLLITQAKIFPIHT